MHRRRFLQSIAAAMGTTLSAMMAQTVEGEQKVILLQSGWDTVNIGDIGHTPGTLRVIEEHLPQVKVICWVMKVDERVTAMLKKRFPRVEFIQGSLKGTAPEDDALRAAFDRCHLFIRNSGMGQDISYMLHCKKIGKPYGLYGQSFFPQMVEGEGAEQRIGLLDEASFIYCRDTTTLATLKKANLTTPILEFGPDGCFGIDVRDEDRALAFMKKHGLEDRKFITIHLRTNTPKEPGVDDPRPQKLNPLYPTPQQVADDDRRAGLFRDIVTAWVNKTGGKVLIAPETFKEMGHNKRLIYDQLLPELQKSVVNLDEFWNADEAASVFARAHTVLCHEPHSPIIALANGTPIMHIFSEFHSPKCWMFKDIGLPEWLLEIDTTPKEKVIETLLAIEADYPAALAKVKKAMDYVHLCFDKGMGDVKGIVQA